MRGVWKNCFLRYPVHALRGEWIPLFRREIRRCESLPLPELRSYQVRKLSRLLQDAYHHDPYYRRLLDPFARGRLLERPMSFFNDLPFLTKEVVNLETGRRRPAPWKRLDRRSTSGSTGFPLRFFKDRLATAYMEAVQEYACSWHGIAAGEAQGRFWGMPTGSGGMLASLKDFLKNRIRFSAFDLTEASMHRFYGRLKKFAPTHLYGYPSLILEFARFLEREKLSLEGMPLKAVIGTGEYVYPHEKGMLENLLGLPYVGEYGCTETGVIGFDCRHGRMHLMAANIMLQVVDSCGRGVQDGEEGEIVVTELNSRFFPFVRYRLGDRGSIAPEACPCGRKLPVLRISAGRKDDYIVTPAGEKVYDAILAYTLKEGILQFKAVQDSADHLDIFVVPGAAFTDSMEREYVSRLQQALTHRMRIDFTRVARIDRESSGKLRYFRSEIGGGT